MANGFSNYLETAIWDWMLKNTAFPGIPASVQLSLHSADPGDTGASELTGNGYARQTITKDSSNVSHSSWNAQSTNGQATTISNKATITFAAASGSNWATATYFGLWDAGGTNLLFTGVITGGVTVNVGNVLSLVDGNLVLSVD